MMTKEAIPLNTALYTQRKLRGWSQAKLAELIGASEEMISKWERGKKRTSPYYQEKLCALFGKNAEELGFLVPASDNASHDAPFVPSSHQQKEAHSQSSYTIKQNILDDVQEFIGEDRDLLQHHVLQKHPGNLFYSELYERLRYALRKPSAVDDATLDHLENITSDCWKMIPVVGGIVSPHSCKYVLECLHTVTRLLESSQPIVTHERLCSIAGKLSLIAANISSNMRDYRTAKAYYETAIEAAQEARNLPLQSVSLVRLSFNSTRSERPDVALPLVQEANYLITHCGQHATVTTRSWIAAVCAEVYANLKESKACFEMLDHAELQYTSTKREEDPYYTTFSSSLFAGYKGTCYTLLHLSEDAEKALREALKQRPLPSIYQKGYILSDLAHACIQQGKLEETYNYASEALTVAVQANAPEIFQRICKLRNEFGSWTLTSSLIIRDLETQIHDLEPHFYGTRG